METKAQEPSFRYRQLTLRRMPDTVDIMATRRKRPTKKVEKAQQAPPHSFTLGLWLAKLEMSHEDLADRLGVGRVTVWKWVVGAHQPRPHMIERIAKALAISPADLWRSPTPTLISLDAAATHITNNDVRQALAALIKTYPAS